MLTLPGYAFDAFGAQGQRDKAGTKHCSQRQGELDRPLRVRAGAHGFLDSHDAAVVAYGDFDRRLRLTG